MSNPFEIPVGDEQEGEAMQSKPEIKQGHTPGPWIILDDTRKPCQITAKGSAIRVADVWATDFPDGQANARLIAAAPDLLAALKAIMATDLPEMDDKGPQDEGYQSAERFSLWEQVNAVIAAAEGREA